METPATTTGKTYAKAILNIVSFGFGFPEQKEIIHQLNEWMDIKEIIMNSCYSQPKESFDIKYANQA